jgi:hypothetical protein
VLEDAFVDFVFIAMINVVVQVKVFLFISDVRMLFLDFFLSSHSSAPSNSVAYTVREKGNI